MQAYELSRGNGQVLNVATLESLVRFSRCGREALPTWCISSSSGRRKRIRGQGRGKEEGRRKGRDISLSRRRMYRLLLPRRRFRHGLRLHDFLVYALRLLFHAPVSLLWIDSSLIACCEMDSERTRGAWHGHSQQRRRRMMMIEVRRTEKR